MLINDIFVCLGKHTFTTMNLAQCDHHQGTTCIKCFTKSFGTECFSQPFLLIFYIKKTVVRITCMSGADDFAHPVHDGMFFNDVL